MSNYVIAPAANNDINKIWSRISRDSVTPADAVEEAIIDSCEFLAQCPRAGHSPDRPTRRDVLIWPVKPYENYLIVYLVVLDHIRILRVLHGARWNVWRQL